MKIKVNKFFLFFINLPTFCLSFLSKTSLFWDGIFGITIIDTKRIAAPKKKNGNI